MRIREPRCSGSRRRSAILPGTLIVGLCLAGFARPSSAQPAAMADHEPVHPAASQAEPDGPVEQPEDLGPEAARERDSQARAVELFELGSQYYVQAKYERALEAFLDAQTLYPSAEFQYNIGVCHEQLEQYDAAARAYQTYLRNVEVIEDRANIENKVRRLTALANKSRAAEQAVQTVTVPTPAQEPRAPGRGRIILGAVGLSAAVVGGSVGVIALGTVALANSRAIEGLAEGRNPDHLTLDDAKEADAGGRRAESWQFAVGGVCAALAIGSTVLMISGIVKRKANAARTQARLAASLSPRGVALSLRGSF